MVSFSNLVPRTLPPRKRNQEKKKATNKIVKKSVACLITVFKRFVLTEKIKMKVIKTKFKSRIAKLIMNHK